MPTRSHTKPMLLLPMVVCLLLIVQVAYSIPLVSLPLSLQELDYITGEVASISKSFVLHRNENPWRAVRKFCWTEHIQAGDCSAIPGYLLSLLDRENNSLIATISGYTDNVIIQLSSEDAASPLIWGELQLKIDIGGIGESNKSDYLNLPAFSSDVQMEVEQFCAGHSLRGLHCRELAYEVHNYITSLYYRPGGVTLRNMLMSMYYQDYLQYVYIVVDEGDASRYFFAQYPSHFLASTKEFCVDHHYNRTQCTYFMERVDRELNLYYEVPNTELSLHVYILKALSSLVDNPQQQSSVAHEKTSGDFIDADFIEIGTSNFNTITQLVDDTDALRGFAVEPSIHYLNSLPDKTGITKVLCTVVPATIVNTHSPDSSIILPCNFAQLLQGHRIRRIRLLKVDAEGYDLTIISELYQYIVARNDPVLYPERIVLEGIPIAHRNTTARIAGIFARNLDYKIVMLGRDVILERLLFTARQYVEHALNTIILARKAEDEQVRKVQSVSTEYVDADFIEIGTSNFDTITQYVLDSDNLVGFAVEPSLHYLSSLPNKTGVTKVNCAIVPARYNSTEAEGIQEDQHHQQGVQQQRRTVDLYHIPEADISLHGLPSFLKGCNSIGSYHQYHVILNLTELVVIDKVPAYTIAQLLQGHRIRRIRLLKVDAEGYDLTIISELYQYIVTRNDPVLYPERIVFETNDERQNAALQELLGRFRALGYRMVLLGEDTILERLQDPIVSLVEKVLEMNVGQFNK